MTVDMEGGLTLCLREQIARAIYDAPNDIDGDQIADMLIEDFRIFGTPDECREMVLGVCRKAADAALAAIKAPGWLAGAMLYLVVLEADDGSWLSFPEMYDTLDEAKTSIGDGKSNNGEWVFYECRRGYWTRRTQIGRDAL